VARAESAGAARSLTAERPHRFQHRVDRAKHRLKMLEPIFGLLLCVAIYFAISAWSTFSSEFQRDADFERWCAGKPIIIAFRCPGDRADDARHRIRQMLAPHDELVNKHGGAPWQYYRFDVVVRALADDVVAVQISAPILQRGHGLWRQRRDAAELVVRLVAARTGSVAEVWMHGQLHPSEARSTARDQRSWIGHVAEDGGFQITPMIGRPQWIQAVADDESA
jgi:hypothetical protein